MKMNVLHIHLTDAQAFTLDVPDYPDLSVKGTYSQSQIFNQSHVHSLVEHARRKGVIIIPEIDMPAHTGSWNLGYPGAAIDCWDYIIKSKMNNGENILGLNPTYSGDIFEMISKIIKHVSKTFDGQFMHVGGDEVNLKCYTQSKEYQDINNWMEKMGMSELKEVQFHFNNFAQSAVINNTMRPIVWEEVYQSGVIDKSSIVQVWNNISCLDAATRDGYQAIFSSGWYFDRQLPKCSKFVPNSCDSHNYMWVWTNRDFYKYDPVNSLSDAQKKLVIGGEACSWGESVDYMNFFERTFQRTAAVAERLWSKSSLIDANNHEVRADYFRCTLLRKGMNIQFGPLYHNFCEL